MPIRNKKRDQKNKKKDLSKDKIKTKKENIVEVRRSKRNLGKPKITYEDKSCGKIDFINISD